jgi:signal transduction histidine kinase
MRAERAGPADLFWLLSTASREATIGDLSRVIAEGMIRMLHASEAAVYLAEGDPVHLFLTAWQTTGSSAARPQADVGLDDPHLAGRTARNPYARLLAARELGSPGLLDGTDPARVYAEPLRAGDALVGVLVVAFPEPLTAAQRDVLSATAGPIAAFFDRVRRSDEHVSEQRILEHAEKLRALGEMAAGVTHDLRNVLAPLSLSCQLLRRTLKRGGPGAPEIVEEMEHILARGVETVNRIRRFSRDSAELPPEPLDLGAVAHEAAQIARMHASSAAQGTMVEILEDLGPGPRVVVRSADLVAALLNLLGNAIEAMKDGGVVTVRTGAGDGGAWVRISDQGPGIPEALRRRVFEPFFTTKGGEGTGLGLSIVRGVVQRHGGRVTLEDAEPRGACFTLWFPTAATVAEDAAAGRGATPSAGKLACPSPGLVASAGLGPRLEAVTPPM